MSKMIALENLRGVVPERTRLTGTILKTIGDNPGLFFIATGNGQSVVAVSLDGDRPFDVMPVGAMYATHGVQISPLRFEVDISSAHRDGEIGSLLMSDSGVSIVASSEHSAQRYTVHLAPLLLKAGEPESYRAMFFNSWRVCVDGPNNSSVMLFERKPNT